MIRAIETRYGGRLYRSRSEARWAVFFDALGIAFDYEADGYDIRGGYLPDFWLRELRMFLEVKGADPTDDERRKCAELAQAAEYDCLLAVGPPEERWQILWFDRAGEREGRYVFAQDRIADCGFWLLNEDGETANHVGPWRSAQTPKGPMLSGALEWAYSLAAQERFEGASRSRRHQPCEHPEDRRASA